MRRLAGARRSVLIDTTAPVVRITTPTEADSVQVTSMPVTISGTAQDSYGIAKIEYFLIAGATRDSALAQGAATWSIPDLNLTPGLTVVVVRATDSTGNTSSDTLRVKYSPQVVAPPSVSFREGYLSVSKTDSVCTIGLLLSRVHGDTVRAYCTAVSGSALRGSDFRVADTVVVFKPGDTVGIFRIDILANPVVSPARMFLARLLTTSPNAARGSRDSVTVTITDSTRVTVGFAQTSGNGTEGTRDSLRVRISHRTATDVRVHCRLKDGGTAVNGAEFTFRDDSLLFGPGDTVKKIPVETRPDTVRNGNRDFYVALFSPRGAVLGADSVHHHTILDDERVFARFLTGSGTVAAPPSGTSILNLPVRLSCRAAHQVTVSYAVTRAGTAAASEYTLPGTSITFAPGDTASIIPVTVNSTTVKKQPRYFVVGLTGITPGDSLGPIAEDSVVIVDTLPLTVSFVSGARSASERSGRDSIGVVLSRRAAFPVSVAFAFTDSTAKKRVGTSGGDYLGRDSTLTFAAGDTVRYLPVILVDNAVQEGNRVFFVSLSDPVNATLGAVARSTYTITDDEQLTIGFTTNASQGAESKTLCSLLVDLSTQSTQPTTVTYATLTDGSAGDSDYVLTPTPLTIPARSTRGYVIFTVRNDTSNEDPESFTVELRGANNGAVIDTTRRRHTYSITDDDPVTVAFSTASDTVTEGSAVQVQVALSRPSEKSISVEFARTGGSANLTRDYLLSASPIAFGPLETRRTISVTTVGNHLNTDTTSVLLTLSTTSRGTLGTRTQHTVIIRDADSPPAVSLSCPETVNEGSALTATIGLGDSTGRTVKVFYSTVAVNSVAGVNFTAVRDSAVFLSGWKTPPIQAAFTVATIGNSLDDDGKTFRVQIDSVVRERTGFRRKDTTTPASVLVTINDDDAIPANVIVVKHDATGAGTGLSWGNAFTSLDSALELANSSPTRKEVWVARGTYRPKTASGFALHAGAMYGGFVGGEILLSSRDRAKLLRENTTTLSGDLNGNNMYDEAGDAMTLITPRTPSSGDYLMDGFLLSFAGTGAGRVQNRIFTIRNCIFTDSIRDVQVDATVSLGGNVTTVDLWSCTFVGNSTSVAVLGGEPYGTTNVAARNCIFYGFSGSKVSVRIVAYEGKKVFANCTFVRNVGSETYGVIQGYIDTLVNCFMWHNTPFNMINAVGILENSIIDTTGMSPIGDSWYHWLNNYEAPPAFVNVGSLFGSDGFPGGGDDGLLLPSGDYGRSFGNASYAPNEDILGNPRRKFAGKCTVGVYEQE